MPRCPSLSETSAACTRRFRSRESVPSAGFGRRSRDGGRCASTHIRGPGSSFWPHGPPEETRGHSDASPGSFGGRRFKSGDKRASNSVCSQSADEQGQHRAQPRRRSTAPRVRRARSSYLARPGDDALEQLVRVAKQRFGTKSITLLGPRKVRERLTEMVAEQGLEIAQERER